jgi:molecular chaperone IbpA
MHISYAQNQSQTFNSLYPGFTKWAIGFDPLINTFNQISQSKDNYPPYNVRKEGEQHILELAVAGFTKDELDIEVKELLLTVTGTKAKNEAEYVYQGISAKSFSREFALAEYVIVKGAKFQDGLLTITLEQELPEEKKAKTISIE